MLSYSIIDLDITDFRLYDGTIGVNVSGGVDSTLLLYVLMKYSKNKIHAFTISSDEKFRINSKTAVDVINRCIDLTGNFNVEHHIIYQPTQNVENLHRLAKEFLVTGRIDFVYTGVTANPPIEVCNTFNEERISIRDYEIKKPTVFEEEKYYNPWANLHKKQICQLYQQLNILESLFPLTRSCEYYKKYVGQQISSNYHCGVCWWCQERLWGFGKL